MLVAMRPIRIALFGLVLGVVGCDHATKAVAEARLAERAPIELVAGVLDLHYTQNHDVGFSLLRAIPPEPRRLVILTLGLAMAVGIGWAFARARTAPILLQAGLAVLLAGAIGNLLDRLARGYVVDFIHLHHWPVFNVADMAVCLGVVAVVWASRRSHGPSSA